MNVGGPDAKVDGAVLRRARQKAGLTQEELAAKTGLSVRTIGDLERGLTAKPHRRSLEILAEVLELPEPSRMQLVETSRQSPAPAAANSSQPRRADGPAQLPTDIPDFTGRASQAEELCSLLLGNGGKQGAAGVRIALVTGSGGLGKTTLAVHTAHRLASQFPDGQLYANLLGATQPANPSDVLARFLRDFGLDAGTVPADLDERAGRYRTLLAGHRVLIVLDDARDAAQVRPLLPGSASCAVLITTRGQMPGLAGARTIDLDVLLQDEARRLFDLVVGQERAAAEPGATDDVLAACAGLPLAIRIAAARLATRSSWTVQTLADRLADEHRRLDVLRAGDLGVRASFEVSFTSLPGPPHPGGVDPAQAFRLLGLWTGPSISLPAASALLGEDEDAAADALDVLLDAHLLESPEPDRYRFHDLLRVYAADRARTQVTEQDRCAAVTRLLTWYLHTTEAAAKVISAHHARVPLDAPPDTIQPLCFTSLDQALAWCKQERAALAVATHLAAVASLHEIAWKLPAAAMSFYYRRGYWGDWVATHQIGLESARASGDLQAEAWMLNNLGIAYGDQRMEECLSCFEQAVALYGEAGDKHGEARASVNLANALLDIGQFAKARPAAERALSLHRERFYRHGEGIALNILGCTCRELGQLNRAIEHLQAALAIFRELGDRMMEADSLSELGETYLQFGQLSDGIASLRASLTIGRDTGDRHHQAVSLHRFGRGQRQAGDLRLAYELFTEALKLCEELGETKRAAEIRVDLASMSEEGR
jgi:tetratricopeptide (TPR) repeat protein/transcriptional regulator with XRE-family HTH domain